MEKVGAIILAGGKGKRMNSHTVNKVTVSYHHKPLIVWGVELLAPLVSETVIVVGAFAESVKKAIHEYGVSYAYQNEQLGTAHAVTIGYKILKNKGFSHILVGYGDHMMHYRQKDIKKMIAEHITKKEAMTLVVSECDDVEVLGYGRIIRDSAGYVTSIVEKKDADDETRKIKEFNAGLYCFRADFLEENLPLIPPSPVTGEYYITELVRIAVEKGKKVLPFHIPYSYVGIGINSRDDLERSGTIYGV